MLVSGGDPLTLSDERLEFILSNLRAIPHVEIIRLGTKIPAVLPQRVTPQLVRMLTASTTFWMSPACAFPAPRRVLPRDGQGLRHAGRRRHPARLADGPAQGHE